MESKYYMDLTYKKIAFLAVFCIAVTTLYCNIDIVYAQSEKNAYWDNKNIRLRTTYTSQGNITSKTFYREDGSLEKFEKYDTDGNQIEEGYYGDDGKLCQDSVDNFAAIRRTYQGGRLVSDTTFNATGKMIERRIYNASGDLVDRQYVGDNDPNPEEEYSPPLELSGRTDEFYNSDGKKEYQTSTYKDLW